jgi:hypothetical protein
LLAPVLVEKQVAGVLEVWQEAPTSPDVPAAWGQFVGGMARVAGLHARNHRLQTLAGQQQLWTKLEGFCQRIHDSLKLRDVAYHIVNEGRQLVECDRLTVAGRCGRRTRVEAVSGVDVIDQRSNQVQLLGRLCDHVLDWGELLVYRGQRDEALPPAVLSALDKYLAECAGKLLVVQPLRPEKEGSKPRFALVMECFDPATAPEELIARLDVVARHARGAVHNAAAYRRIPLRWLWQPLAAVQEGLGGPAAVWTAVLAATLVAVLAALVCLPFPLKMDATGQLLPRERRWLYAPVEGQVVRFEQGVQPGSAVAENQSLVLMYDVQLELKLVQLANEIAAAQEEITALATQLTTARNDAERVGYSAEKKQKEYVRNRKMAELRALRERTHADEARPGYFWLKAPLSGTVLTWEFRERLTHRTVKPSDPLLRIGDKDRGWEVELKIPHKHVGQVLEAFAADPAAELDVDLLVLSAPTRTFKGKLARQQLAGEASPDRDTDGGEPVVRAAVRIDGPDIADAERIPPELLVSGTEVHAKVRCGDRRMGYALFYGVWEFFYEKVLFF